MGRHHQPRLSTLAGAVAVFVVGLTGGIGSGKTEVSNRFAQHGVPVIDTDHLARELVEPGQVALAEIAATFGTACLDAQGRLRRDYLREHVFTDPGARHQLETILHPRIRTLLQTRIAALTTPYCLAVIPLLIETGMTELVDRILVVDVAETEQIRRVMHRDQLTEDQAHRILAAQSQRTQRLAYADDVLENIGDLVNLEHQVEALHQRYLALASTKTT